MVFTAAWLARSVTRIELYANSHLLGTATGFFVKQQDKWYLVRNWHVFAGRHPDTGQPLDKNGGIPDSCKYTITRRIPAPDGVSVSMIPVQYEASLGSADIDSATWLQHHNHGQDCDIGCLPLEDHDMGYAKDFINESSADIVVDLCQDVFIPGYPLGLASNGHLPIWKRASVASSLILGEGENWRFYVDTATRTGMSGSPCFSLPSFEHYRYTDEGIKIKLVREHISSRFLGVYSGRLNPSDTFEAQIGIVWREHLLFDILREGVPATVTIRSQPPP